MNIVVIRDTGDKAGPSISGSLLTTAAAGAERGRVEIDINLYNKETVTTEVTDFSYIQNGSLIRVGDEGVSMLIGIEADYSAEGSTIKIIREKLANDM